MNILYVTARPLEINSSASLRNIDTINGLSRLKHNVTVITACPNKKHPQYSDIHLDGEVELLHLSSGVTKNISAEMSRNVFLNKIRTFIYKFRQKKNIYDSWKCVVEDKKLNQIDYAQFDLLLSSSDPKSSHLMGEKIFEKKNLPWIQIWGDPFTGDITNVSYKLEEKRKHEEQRFLKEAQKVVYLSELTAQEMKEKYPQYAFKIRFMPRMYLEPIITNPQIKAGQKLRLAYCGDYVCRIRNIRPLYNAVGRTGDQLTICGNSDIVLESTKYIQVYSRVPTYEVLRVEAEADVLVHLSNARGNQIPGKVYNFSATDKPILFILDGEKTAIKQTFEKYNRYIFCDNTEEDIERALKEIRSGQYNGRFANVAEFSYDVVLNQLIEGKWK